jgi:hypothetical protein
VLQIGSLRKLKRLGIKKKRWRSRKPKLQKTLQTLRDRQRPELKVAEAAQLQNQRKK